MPKLKSLRAAVGSYGRVAANGIVEVDENQAAKLTKSGRFVKATAEDIKAAQKAQKAALAVQVQGVAPGFTPMPERSTGDRLQHLMARGDISADDARRLAALQVELSTDEVRALIQRDLESASAQIATQQADLDTRTADLDAREQSLAERQADLDAREKALADKATASKATADKAEAAASAAIPAEDDADKADDKPAKAKAGK